MNEKKEKKMRKQIASQVQDLANRSTFTTATTSLKGKTTTSDFMDKATELIVENRQAIMNVAGIVLPIIAKKVIEKK